MRSVAWMMVFAALVVRPELLRADEKPIRYLRDVRPILAAKCWHCHGPDDKVREAELRLDEPESVFGPRESGAVIVPGEPASSLLMKRIQHADPEQKMPPADEPRQLTSSEIRTLEQWIAEGADFQKHWAFQPPVRPNAPPVQQESWIRNPIDRFVLARLEAEGMRPAKEANRRTLIRRLSMDLTGLPPSPREVQRFLSDTRPDAYERLVDGLLASPAYGERMGLLWLDAARFADSGGYQGDILRSMWLWRDWVIRAYNDGMPFDQFTIEQLAGDLLPNPTEAQQIATGFHRNHRINDEDGIILEEFRVEYVADRVETTSTVWLGLTMGCARCHDHKYDPWTQRDYYRLFAFFNSIDEKGRGHGNAPPLLRKITPSMRRQLDGLRAKIAAADAESQAKLQKAHDQLLASAPTVMVMQELAEPRPTHVLIRGAYNRPGDAVTAGFPTALAGQKALVAERRNTRLDLAHWLLSRSNPLTARVAVNRYWQIYFGRGLVDTQEDFGSQGALPTHPELLDWLAVEFMDSQWDVKGMHRMIVSSAAYRQSSSVAVEAIRQDPDNRLLGRASRFRLPAELLRDQALASAGMLVRRIGGPSVKPYQPPGLWRELMSASREYKPSTGADLYRRGMYTFLRRTVPHPAMTTIDGPNREICVMRRSRTNTPTQALVLMNDPQFVEAARVLAESILRNRKAWQTDADAVSQMMERVLSRSASPREAAVLTDSVHYYRQRYQGDAEAASRLAGIGETPPDGTIDAPELAAWTMVANVILNLDETLTRE